MSKLNNSNNYDWRFFPFATSVVDTGGSLKLRKSPRICHRICHRCRWHRWQTLSHEYLREFSKKFEMTLMVYSGAWGNLIHEKNQKSKISWHCPFKADPVVLSSIHMYRDSIHGQFYTCMSDLSCSYVAHMNYSTGLTRQSWTPSTYPEVEFMVNSYTLKQVA